jgi:hypothetical protein
LQKEGFRPLAVPYGIGSVVLLRISAESNSWLEVEINEDTRKTKFISKRDPMWSTTTYAHWLAESEQIRLEGTQYLRDKPDGMPIEAYREHLFDDVVVRKIEGDWVLVDGVAGAQSGIARGWVRWRNGREILVGCGLNDGRVSSTAKKILAST